MRKFVSTIISTFIILWICYGSTTPVVKVTFPNGESRNFTKEIEVWQEDQISLTFVNEENTEAMVKVDFVDGTYTNDSLHFRACGNEFQKDAFGGYLTWTTFVNIPANHSKTMNYTIKLPKSYQYSGEIPWCVTVSTVEQDTAQGTFKILTRKAFFMDLEVNPSHDNINPRIIGYSPTDGASNLPINTEIKIIFSEPMNKTSVKNALQFNGAYTLDWNENTTELTISPITSYQYDTSYTVILENTATDLFGNPLEEGIELTFSTEKKQEVWPQSWNYGFSSKLHKDYCPEGDFSDSYYDGSCGEYFEGESEDDTVQGTNTCSIRNSIYSEELDNAYRFACENRITTKPTIQEAEMMKPILRKHLAKMISEFTLRKVGKPLDFSKRCEFNDMKGEDEEMQYYVITACQLWLMGMQPDGVHVMDQFYPNQYVTRAEFGTILSRMLWGTKYAPFSGQAFYTRHLEALHKNNIVSNIYDQRPKYIELRGRVMLMLHRVYENILFTNYEDRENIDQGNIIITPEGIFGSIFDTTEYQTNKDYLVFQGEIDNEEIHEIHITHANEYGTWIYDDYRLKKYKPWDQSFRFYASRNYNTLTVNSKNTYQFTFYDHLWKVLSERVITIDHNYQY